VTVSITVKGRVGQTTNQFIRTPEGNARPHHKLKFRRVAPKAAVFADGCHCLQMGVVRSNLAW
jgi:hypothetical protein